MNRDLKMLSLPSTANVIAAETKVNVKRSGNIFEIYAIDYKSLDSIGRYKIIIDYLNISLEEPKTLHTEKEKEKEKTSEEQIFDKEEDDDDEEDEEEKAISIKIQAFEENACGPFVKIVSVLAELFKDSVIIIPLQQLIIEYLHSRELNICGGGCMHVITKIRSNHWNDADPLVDREHCSHRFHPLCLRIRWLMMLRSSISPTVSGLTIPDKYILNLSDYKDGTQTQLIKLVLKDKVRIVPFQWCPLCDEDGPFIKLLAVLNEWIYEMTHYFSNVLIGFAQRPYIPIFHKLDLPYEYLKFGDVIPFGRDDLSLVDHNNMLFHIKEQRKRRIETSIIPYRFWKARGRSLYRRILSILYSRTVIFEVQQLSTAECHPDDWDNKDKEIKTNNKRKNKDNDEEEKDEEEKEDEEYLELERAFLKIWKKADSSANKRAKVTYQPKFEKAASP